MADEQKDIIGKAEVTMGNKDATAKTELPLRLLVVGDFIPESPDVQDWSASSYLVNITPANFKSVMQQLEPSLSLDVPNRLKDSPKELKVELSFTDMKSFDPESVAQQVDELADILEMRHLVSQVKDGKLKVQEFDEKAEQLGIDSTWIHQFHQMLSASKTSEEAKPSTSESQQDTKSTGGTLDSLLNIVDADDENDSDEPSHQVGNLLGAIAGSKGTSGADKTAVDRIINELDQILSRQINEIIHHKKFQQLESTWRGLKFLVDRTDFQEDIKIELLSAHKDELRDAIYNQVFIPEYNEISEFPLSVIIADYEFDKTPEEVELLTDIGQIGSSIQVPFISSVGFEFFGVKTSDELAKLPMLNTLFREPQYAEWNALRDKEEAQYIAMTLPRFLLRLPYGPDGKKVKAFGFVEDADSFDNYLWGRGVFAVASTLVRSFKEDGWGVRITGIQGGGIVENLPIWSYHTAGREVRIPLEVTLPQSREREFTDNGFVFLSCNVNDNRAYALGTPTICRPRKYEKASLNKAARLHTTLPYRIFATRMSHYLQRIVKDISTGLTAEQLQIELTGKLRMILAKSGEQLPVDAVIVEVNDSEDSPDYYDVIMRIMPTFKILGWDVDLLLRINIHK
jgi:type VI secretion system protein ImpC